MDRKIIHFPTPAERRAKAAASLSQDEQIVELTMTIPKAEPGPTSIRY